MKNSILLLTLLLCGALQAQKVKTTTAKIDFKQYPSVPVEGVQQLGIKVYTANLPFNKDTLRFYLDNMDLMKSDAEQISKIKYESLNEIALIGGDGDLTASMALGTPVIVGKETKKNSCITPKDGCVQYYYEVQYKMPAYLQISKGGTVYDTWKLDPDMTLKFGNEQIETHEETDAGTITSVRVISYESEPELAMAFADYGESWLARKGIVTQLATMSEALYENVFFSDEKLKIDISYGSGSAADYTEMETAADAAVEALENANFAALAAPIATWENWLTKYDSGDKKAAVNKKVAQGLHKNLSIGYTFTNDFEKATDHLEQALALAKDGNVNVNEVSRLEEFNVFIKKQEGVHRHNSNLTVSKLHSAPDIKKTLGRRNQNENLNFLIAEDKFPEMVAAYGAGGGKQDISEMTVEEFMSQPAASSSADNTAITLEGRVENDMLILSGLVDGNMRGQALPASICEYPDIKVIRAKNIGLTALPECMETLTKLEKLIIGSNDFESIPDFFGNMTNLEVLDISNNGLTAIPPSIFELSSLNKITIEGNQFSEADVKKLEETFPKAKIK
jgi:hypothetical protein